MCIKRQCRARRVVEEKCNGAPNFATEKIRRRPGGEVAIENIRLQNLLRCEVYIQR